MILSNYRTHLSLAIVPVAILLGRMGGIHPSVTFTMNLLAVFPLSIVLTAATETLASEIGVITGSLLNISCGNLAEIIILYTVPRWMPLRMIANMEAECENRELIENRDIHWNKFYVE